MGIRDRPAVPRSLWQNGYVEPLIDLIRRRCNHIILAGNDIFVTFCRRKCNATMRWRTHLASLKKNAPLAHALGLLVTFLPGSSGGRIISVSGLIYDRNKQSRPVRPLDSFDALLGLRRS